MCMLHVHACIKNNIRKRKQGTVRPPSVLRPPLFPSSVVLSALSSSPFATVWSPPPRGRCVFSITKLTYAKKIVYLEEVYYVQSPIQKRNNQKNVESCGPPDTLGCCKFGE